MCYYAVTASESSFVSLFDMQILMSVLYRTITVMIMLLAITPMEALPALVMKDIMVVGVYVLVSCNEDY